VRPTLYVAASPGIAHFDMEDRSITVDPRLIDLADASSKNGDKLLAYILGHEYAHYVRGHEFNRKFHHTFGSILDNAGERPGLSEMLSASRKDEFEADYYGLYYSYLGGYRYSAIEIQKFMDAMKIEFQTGDVSYTHPAWSQRKLVVDTVLTELERLALAYHSANALLLCGKYEQSIMLYDWISSTVSIPDAQWNEVVSRILYTQSAMRKPVFDPSALVQQVNLSPLLRDGVGSSLNNDEIIDQLDKCESILETLSARRYSPLRCTYASNLVSTMRSAMTCDACNHTALCTRHQSMATAIPSEKPEDDRAAQASDIAERQIRSAVQSTERRLTALRRALPSSSIPSKYGDINIVSNQEDSSAESRVTITNQVGTRIAVTVVSSACRDCTTTIPVVYTNAVAINTEGQRIYAVIVDADE
jgi:hypothetical protein